MGFRFRKSVKVLPGVKLNISKSGISTSVGRRGATVNFSKRGTRATVGIPGMLFYISALISILIKCIKNIKNDNVIMNMCCFFVIAHLISSMFGVTIYNVTVYFIIILGITLKFLVNSEVNIAKDI